MKAEEYEFQTCWYGPGDTKVTPPDNEPGWELMWWRPVVCSDDTFFDVALWRRKK